MPEAIEFSGPLGVVESVHDRTIQRQEVLRCLFWGRYHIGGKSVFNSRQSIQECGLTQVARFSRFVDQFLHGFSFRSLNAQLQTLSLTETADRLRNRLNNLSRLLNRSWLFCYSRCLCWFWSTDWNRNRSLLLSRSWSLRSFL